MIGPNPKGFHTQYKAPNRGTTWGHLIAGRQYIVVREFLDYNNDLHPEGESWKFLGYSFSQMDDGLSLFVTLDDVQEWSIPLQGLPEEQIHVTNSLESYMQEKKNPGLV